MCIVCCVAFLRVYVCAQGKADWSELLLQRILAFGPRNVGSNVLSVSPHAIVNIAYDGKGFSERLPGDPAEVFVHHMSISGI